MPSARRRAWRVVILAIAALLAVAYVTRADEHGRRLNANPQAFDQSAYMHFAEKMAATGYRYLTDGARGPLYPAAQSIFLRPGLDEASFFESGKRRNVALSLLGLALLGAVFVGTLGAHTAANLLGVTAFTVFLFKAAYFQPELAFYVAFFLGFWLACRALARPTLSGGLAAGLALGVAHLLKPSAIVALVLFVGAMALLGGRGAARGRSRPALRAAVAAVACAAGFALVTAPYLAANRQTFGDPLYNVNTTFYVWYDSWDEVKAGTRAHGDRKGWPDMPASQLPGPSRYWREHGLAGSADRLTDGIAEVLATSVGSYGYAKYAALYTLLAVAAIVVARTEALALARANAAVAAFGVSFFGAYTLSFAWFGPINYGERLVLSLFVPWLYSCARIAAALPMHRAVRLGAREVGAPVLFEWAVTGLLAVEIAVILWSRILTTTGGS